MQFIRLLPLILSLFMLSSGRCQMITRLDGSKISFSQADSIVKFWMDWSQIQGLSVAILNGNNPVFIRSYGFSNKPKKALLDTATIVYGASFSKAVFGYLVMKLVEEKVIELDKPLYRYLKKPVPAYEYFADLNEDDRWKLITARMCLSHTTGLPNVRWFHPATGAMDTLGVMKIYFPPGSRYAYSGEGFKLLQLVIEELTGRNIDALAQERIFRPFGMTRTGFIWQESFGDDNVAVGHMNNGAIDQKRKRTEPVAGGSLVTTIADYSRFIAHVMKGKGLGKERFREMISPQVRIYSKTQFPPITNETTNENDGIQLSYGLGWGVMKCADGRAFFKEGNGESWRNYNINYPDKGISIIIMSNSENGEKVFKGLAEGLLADSCIPWKWQGYYPFDGKN